MKLQLNAFYAHNGNQHIMPRKGTSQSRRRRSTAKGGRPPKITEEAVDLCVELLARRMTKGAIKAALKTQFDVAARSCETVLARAREEMLERSGRDKGQHRTDALAFYEAVLRDEGSPTVELSPAVKDESGNVVVPAVIRPARPAPSAREKLHAQERIDRLLGLEVPQQVQLTGADGGPIKALVGIDLDKV